MANEIVSQYNRFNSEKEEFEDDMKKTFDNKFENILAEKETEADQLEKDFNQQLSEKIDEFNNKIQGTDLNFKT